MNTSAVYHVHRSSRALWPALLIPLMLAGGCASVRTALDADNVEYRNARQGSVLDVPPDLVAPRADNRYALPRRDEDGQSLLEFNRQRRDAQGDGNERAGGVLPQTDTARIHRDGQTRWIVVEADPEAVWPVLVEFWAVQGFNLEMAEPELGIMETDWAERYQRVENTGIRGILTSKTGAIYATGERDKYRTRIERAPDGGTEIYLTYYGREEIVTGRDKNQSIWQANNENRRVLEVEYLSRILARLGTAFAASGGAAEPPSDRQADTGAVATDEATGAGAAQGTAESRGRLVPVEGGAPQLVVVEPFERAWREIGLILDRLDFAIEDRHRDQGVYNIRYVDPERRDRGQGSFSRFFSGERKDLSGQHYQLLIRGEGAESTVDVRRADGSPVSSEEDLRVAGSILKVLHENL
ncbi:MAG: outer membrane protein assembly factor BamC [Lautropia sp.]|nr:outer membrane protein assembly factor BamC [Lautropia sp.]